MTDSSGQGASNAVCSEGISYVPSVACRICCAIASADAKVLMDIPFFTVVMRAESCSIRAGWPHSGTTAIPAAVIECSVCSRENS